MYYGHGHLRQLEDKMKKIIIGMLLGAGLLSAAGFTFRPSGNSSNVDVSAFVTDIQGHEYAIVVTSTRAEYGYIRTSVAMTHHVGCKACGNQQEEQ